MAKLKPLKDDKELGAIPTNEPVLVQLEPTPTAVVADDIRDEDVALSEQDGATPSDDRELKRERKRQDSATILKTQLEASEAARRAQAERAERAEHELRLSRTQVVSAETDLVQTGLAGAQAELASAKQELKSAGEAADWDKMGEAQAKIARAASDIRTYERAAAELSERKEMVSHQPEAPLTDAHQIIDRMQILPTEKEWLRTHPDAIMDQGRKIELDAAYIQATRKGLVRGTPAYFSFLENFMGYNDGEGGERRDNASRNGGDSEREITVAAPVSRETRSSANGQPNGGNQVLLTPEQRDMARSMGLTDVQYAQGVARLREEKKINPEKFGTSR